MNLGLGWSFIWSAMNYWRRFMLELEHFGFCEYWENTSRSYCFKIWILLLIKALWRKGLLGLSTRVGEDPSATSVEAATVGAPSVFTEFIASSAPLEGMRGPKMAAWCLWRWEARRLLLLGVDLLMASVMKNFGGQSFDGGCRSPLQVGWWKIFLEKRVFWCYR